MAGDKSDEHNVETPCASKLLITQAAYLLKYSMELWQRSGSELRLCLHMY